MLCRAECFDSVQYFPDLELYFSVEWTVAISYNVHLISKWLLYYILQTVLVLYNVLVSNLQNSVGRTVIILYSDFLILNWLYYSVDRAFLFIFLSIQWLISNCLYYYVEWTFVLYNVYSIYNWLNNSVERTLAVVYSVCLISKRFYNYFVQRPIVVLFNLFIQIKCQLYKIQKSICDRMATDIGTCKCS